MQITLSQLKEIAKAGYESNNSYSNFIDKCDSLEEDDSEYQLYDSNCNCRSIFSLFYPNKKFVSFDAEWPFNHLAAIRKMEELGLIEK